MSDGQLGTLVDGLWHLRRRPDLAALRADFRRFILFVAGGVLGSRVVNAARRW